MYSLRAENAKDVQKNKKPIGNPSRSHFLEGKSQKSENDLCACCGEECVSGSGLCYCFICSRLYHQCPSCSRVSESMVFNDYVVFRCHNCKNQEPMSIEVFEEKSRKLKEDTKLDMENFAHGLQDSSTELKELGANLSQSIKDKDDYILKLKDQLRMLLEKCETLKHEFEQKDPETTYSSDSPFVWSFEFENELRERLRHRQNLVLFYLPESDKFKGLDRKVDDLFQINKVLRHLGKEDVAVKQCVRIGRYSKEKFRPLLLSLHTEQDRDELLSKARLLRHYERFVLLKPDLTKTQQWNLKQI